MRASHHSEWVSGYSNVDYGPTNARPRELRRRRRRNKTTITLIKCHKIHSNCNCGSLAIRQSAGRPAHESAECSSVVVLLGNNDNCDRANENYSYKQIELNQKKREKKTATRNTKKKKQNQCEWWRPLSHIVQLNAMREPGHTAFRLCTIINYIRTRENILR